jgi:Zn-dependent peptidase ImmA (M78 family)
VNTRAYYEGLKQRAREVRAEFQLDTPRVLRSDLRRIYSQYGIKIEFWPYKFKKLRGAFFDDDLGPTVMLAAGVPPEPTVFTMCHELKHFLVDRGLGLSYCDPSNQNETIEIGAEIFAAEMIFPDADFREAMTQLAITPGQCSAESLVRLKRETATTLSYAGIAKKAYFLNFAPDGSFSKIQWKKLEAQIYGEPAYKMFLRRVSKRT